MIFSYMTTFFEFLCIYFSTKLYCQATLKPTKNDCIACLSILLIIGSIPSSYPLVLWSTGQIFYFIYVLILCSPNILNGVILFCLSLGSMVLTQLLIVSVFTFLHINAFSEVLNVTGNLFTLFILLFVLRHRKLRNLYNTILRAALPYKLLFIDTYLLYSGVAFVYKSNPSTLQTGVTFFTFFVLLLVAANACILYYDQKMYAQKQELASYQKNLPIYEALIHEIRANQHEYSNRIQSLQNLTTMYSDYDTLCNAIHQYTKEYHKPIRAYPLLQINMPLLAAALYHLSCKAENQYINMQFDVVSEKLCSQASEQQLADFACILTQNAIEACEEGDNIYVYLSSTDGKVHFEVRNPTKQYYSTKEIRKFFLKTYSTKKNTSKKNQTPHGYGLYMLHQQVTKLDGIIGADCVEYNHKYWMIFHLDI